MININSQNKGNIILLCGFLALGIGAIGVWFTYKSSNCSTNKDCAKDKVYAKTAINISGEIFKVLGSSLNNTIGGSGYIDRFA